MKSPLVAFAAWVSGQCCMALATEPVPRFVDVTGESGLVVRTKDQERYSNPKPHAVAVEDFDGDGLFDVIVGSFGAPHVHYFRNLGGLKFANVTKGSGLETFGGAGTGAAVADFDRDGRLDLYLSSLREGSSRLYRGVAGGRFVDVSDRAGVVVPLARSCAWSDVDADGWVDLFVTCPKGPNRLFRNNHNGTFSDIAKQAGVQLTDRRSLGCAFGDIDGDGKDDLFVANYESQQSTLLKNVGGGRFRDVSGPAGFGRKASTVGCAWADVFNHGRLDLYTTTDSWLAGANYTETQLLKRGNSVESNLLYTNQGNGRFQPQTLPVLNYKSLSHDVVLEDLDHDGLVEIYVGVDAESGNRFATNKGGNPLWTRSDGRTWREVAAAWGVKLEANCVCVPAADFDNDGDLDLLLINFYQNVVLYRNQTNNDRWLRVKVSGGKSNPDGIGAQVRLFDAGGKLLGMRHIQSGAGYCRSSPLEAHFGLGKPTTGESFQLEVLFPMTGQHARKRNLKPGQRVIIKESPSG